MNSLRISYIIIAIFAAAVLLMISCSGTAPVIDEMEWRILFRDDGMHRYEELSVSLRISDPDGSEDLSMLTATAGSTGFIWRFPKDEWITETVSGVAWQGLPGIIPIEGSRLPDALYTFRLEDLAGRSDELTLRPDPDRSAIEDVEWPEVSIVNDVLRLKGEYDWGMLILRDENFSPLDIQKVSDGSRVTAGEALWWELWITLEDTSGGFRLGPYPFLSDTIPSETE